MSPWPWTWAVWERVKYGSMGRASEDIGPLMLVAIAVTAIMLAHFGLKSASLAAANQLNDGITNIS